MADLHLQHLSEVNKVFLDQIKSADQKAAYIFTFLLALLFWSTETRAAFNWQRIAELGPAMQVLNVVLALSVAVAIVSAILAVLPRARPGVTIYFWGAWPAAADRLVAARSGGDEEFLFSQTLQNTRTLAGICQAKYRMVRIALRAILCAMATYFVLLVLAATPA